MKINSQFAPPENAARELFEMAEQARVEALGAKTLLGCAHNLKSVWAARAAAIRPSEQADAPLPAEALWSGDLGNFDRR